MGQLKTTDNTAFRPSNGNYATDTTNKEKLHTWPWGDGKGLSPPFRSSRCKYENYLKGERQLRMPLL